MSEDKQKKTAGFTHFYVYSCVESTETRGRSEKKGKNATVAKKACGHPNRRNTKEPIDDQHRPQGKPCENCGRRQRLNEGICDENPIRKWEYHLDHTGTDRFYDGRVWRKDGVSYPSRSRTGPADVKARKEWAEREYEGRKQAWLSRNSNASEHSDQTIEQDGELIEQGGELIEQLLA